MCSFCACRLPVFQVMGSYYLPIMFTISVMSKFSAVRLLPHPARPHVLTKKASGHTHTDGLGQAQALVQEGAGGGSKHVVVRAGSLRRLALSPTAVTATPEGKSTSPAASALASPLTANVNTNNAPLSPLNLADSALTQTTSPSPGADRDAAAGQTHVQTQTQTGPQPAQAQAHKRRPSVQIHHARKHSHSAGPGHGPGGPAGAKLDRQGSGSRLIVRASSRNLNAFA